MPAAPPGPRLTDSTDGAGNRPDASPPPPPRRKPAWDEGPLGQKVTLLVLAGSVLGALTGALATQGPLPGAVVWTAWPLTLIGLLAFARAWAVEPIARVVRQAERLVIRREPGLLDQLPVTRRDEAGRLARAAHQLCVSTIQCRHEAKRLRRTLDSRIAEATARATRMLRRIALRDPLTNLGNRRFLDEQLEPLVEVCQISNADLIAVMIDLDGFKLVNDTLGHATGDRLLVTLADLIQASVRPDDAAVRLGGDELLVLMPQATLDRATQFADRLRKMFQQQQRAARADGPFADLSVGIASLHRDRAKTGAELLTRADEYLYTAKRTGKGRTVGGQDALGFFVTRRGA